MNVTTRRVAVLLSCASFGQSLAHCRADDARTAPVISFSEKEDVITIKYPDKEWVIPRPVVSPWEFKKLGKVYWVAPDGRDDSPGTSAKPFKTLAKAVAVVSPGDIVYVQPGTYREYVVVKKSGTEGRPIILSCAPGALGKVKLEPAAALDEKGRQVAGITLSAAQHVWVNGFVIEGTRGLPKAPKANELMTATNGICWILKSGTGCRATNNVVYWNVHCGLKELGHGGSGMTLEGNVSFDNGTSSLDHGIYMPADDVTINGNIVFNNPGYGIHAYSAPKRLVISRNVCFGNSSGGLISAACDSKIYNNTCANNGQGMFYYGGRCKNNDVRNNVFAFNRVDCQYGDGGPKLGAPSDNVDDYNCYFPGKPARQLKPGANEVLADPRFVDAKKGDYRLKPASPCLNRGADVGIPFDGKRPNLGSY